MLSLPSGHPYSLNTLDLISKEVRPKVVKAKKPKASAAGDAKSATTENADVKEITKDKVAEAVAAVSMAPAVSTATSVSTAPAESTVSVSSKDNITASDLTEILNI